MSSQRAASLHQPAIPSAWILIKAAATLLEGQRQLQRLLAVPLACSLGPIFQPAQGSRSNLHIVSVIATLLSKKASSRRLTASGRMSRYFLRTIGHPRRISLPQSDAPGQHHGSPPAPTSHVSGSRRQPSANAVLRRANHEEIAVLQRLLLAGGGEKSTPVSQCKARDRFIRLHLRSKPGSKPAIPTSLRRLSYIETATSKRLSTSWRNRLPGSSRHSESVADAWRKRCAKAPDHKQHGCPN